MEAGTAADETSPAALRRLKEKYHVVLKNLFRSSRRASQAVNLVKRLAAAEAEVAKLKDRNRKISAKLEKLRVSVADGEAYSGQVIVQDDGFKYRFFVSGEREKRRADRIFTKEPGTVAWIKNEVKDGDVFFDIGANVGIYTVLAAMRVKPSGHVYAFEPHAVNFASLLHTLYLNNLASVVHATALPLSSESKFGNFNYLSLGAGTSTSQFDRKTIGNDAFQPKYSELKVSVTVDELVAQGLVRAPSLVKIDVDGLEMEILRGMRKTLRSPQRPRAIQLEIGPDAGAEILEYMASVEFVLAERHWSMSSEALIAQGHDPEACTYNGIFWPKDRKAL